MFSPWLIAHRRDLLSAAQSFWDLSRVASHPPQALSREPSFATRLILSHQSLVYWRSADPPTLPQIPRQDRSEIAVSSNKTLESRET
jgi:hypothetical protein